VSNKVESVQISQMASSIRKDNPIQKIIFSDQIKKTVTPSRVTDPTLGYNYSGTKRSSAWNPPEYNLGEPGRISDVESYVCQAFRKKIALMFKEGWDFVGRNPKTVEYIKLRLDQIANATDTPTLKLFRDVGTGLIQKSNVFLIKARDVKSSGGKIRKVPGTSKALKPVAGYFVAPAETMEFQISGNKVTRWRQYMPDGFKKEFSIDDVIHMYCDRKDGFVFGTPLLVPVIDDIRALRKIEENIELLIYQHLFPLFQWKVGTKEAPAGVTEKGDKEVDVVKQQIQYMPTEGGIVTTERHEVSAIGAEGRALRAESYLTHFKRRVYAGIGMSAIDLGETESSNRSCYSEDTETLTDSGWKFYWEITDQDKIATFNPETNTLEFREPCGKILLYPYQGKMLHFKNRNVDIMVTPDHDMWIAQERKTAKWKKVKAEDISYTAYKFRAGGVDWEGIEPEDFLLPHIPYRYHTHFSNTGPFPRIDISDWLAFLGIFVSEGTFSNAKNQYAISISQSSFVNFEKVVYIRNLLKRLPFKFNEYIDSKDGTTRFWINCKSLYLYLKEECGRYSYLKHLPSEILSYGKEYLKVLFEALMLGDGTKDRRKGRTSRAYYSTSDKLIDQVQEIALKLGYRAHVLEGAGCKRVCISEAYKSKVKPGQVQEVSYNGMVYCFNVPNHLFITRRNGRISIQGNTAEQLSQNLIDGVKDYQQIAEIFINEYIIKELLLESNFKFDVLDNENKVWIRFKEIDVDYQIKRENHYTDQFNKDVINLDEARMDMGREPIPVPSFDEIDNGQDDRDKYPEWYRMHWVLFGRPKALINAIDEPYCYDNETEILTDNGWKYFEDLSSEDKVATLKYNGNCLRFEKPKERQIFDYSGQMYRLKTRFLDVCVTPNHCLYVRGFNRKSQKNKSEFRLVRADKVFGKYKKFKKTAKWKGIEPEFYRLPEFIQTQNNPRHTNLVYKPERDIVIDDWMRLLGWYISEGYFNNSSGVFISQSKNVHPGYYRDIVELLTRLGVNVRCYPKDICFADYQMQSALCTAGSGAINKCIPSYVKNFSSRLLKILLQTMVAGDGESKYHYLYSTISRQLADDVQEIVLKIGWSANIRVEKRENDKRHDIYRVAIYRDKYADSADRMCEASGLAKSNVEDWVEYNGKVYCVTTSTGIVYVRRNGKAYWCGNSNPAKSAAAAEKARQEELAVKKTAAAKKPAAKKVKNIVNDAALVNVYKKTKSEISSYVSNSNKKIDEKWVGQLIRASISSVIDKLHNSQVTAFKKGYSGFGSTRSDAFINALSLYRSSLKIRVEKYVNKLIDDTIEAVQRNIVPEMKIKEIVGVITGVFDSFSYRTKFIENVEIRKAFSFGKVIGMRHLGFSEFSINLGQDACDKCHARLEEIFYDTFLVTLDDVPPFHSSCDCVITFSKAKPVKDTVEQIEDKRKRKKNPATMADCIYNLIRKLKKNGLGLDESELEAMARSMCENIVKDKIDPGKLERCVLKVKKSLRKQHPEWSEEKVKTTAFKICNSKLK